MKKVNLLLTLLSLLLTGTLLHAQQPLQQPVQFNVTNSLQDIKADYGILLSLDKNIEDWRAQYITLTYTRQFWGPLAFRVGGQMVMDPEQTGYMFGAPIALALRPGTRSFASALTSAAGMSVADAIWYGVIGSPGSIGSSIFLNFLSVLFRRSEYFVGVTPGLCHGTHFTLTADAGITLSIPIWRFGLTVSPTYHYAIKPFYLGEEEPVRSMLSLTGGISFLF